MDQYFISSVVDFANFEIMLKIMIDWLIRIFSSIKMHEYYNGNLIQYFSMITAFFKTHTFLLRKILLVGALVLYSYERESKESHTTRNASSRPINVDAVLERLGNVRRLMASILFLNDTQVGVSAGRAGIYRLSHTICSIIYINIFKIIYLISIK